MKKPTILSLIFLIILIPLIYSFSSSSENYETTANIGLGAVAEQSSENYVTEAFMVNQPIGKFESENYSSSAGPYYFYIDIETINILLNSGWNLISIPLTLDNKTLGYALTSIEGNYGNVFTYLNDWEELNENSIINETIGLWIKMNVEDNLTVYGILPVLPINFNLNQGYNLIGYPSLEENVSIVFNDINDSLINVLSYENNSWYSYSPLKINNNLEIIKPGFGYFVNVNESVSLVVS